MQFTLKHFNLILFYIYKTELYSAVEKENTEIIKLLLNSDIIDADQYSILINIYLIKSKLNT